MSLSATGPCGLCWAKSHQFLPWTQAPAPPELNLQLTLHLHAQLPALDVFLSKVYLILGFSVYFHVNHIQVMKVFLVYIQIFNKFINLSVIVSETPIPCFPNYILKCCIPHFHFQVASCLRNAQILKIRVF